MTESPNINQPETLVPLDRIASCLRKYVEFTATVISARDIEQIEMIARSADHFHDLLAMSQQYTQLYGRFVRQVLEHVPDFLEWEEIHPLCFRDMLIFGEILSEGIRKFYFENTLTRRQTTSRGFFGLFSKRTPDA